VLLLQEPVLKPGRSDEMNWKWPNSKEHPECNPWYTIIRRIIFFPGVVICLILFVVMVLLFAGWKEAGMVLKRDW